MSFRSRTNIKIMSLSILFGLLFWLADTIYDFMYFDSKLRHMIFGAPVSFTDSLIFNIQPHDLVSRLIVLTACLLMGYVMIRLTTALSESEEKHRTFINQSPDAIVVLQNGHYAMVNKTFTEMFGYTQEDTRAGLSYMDLVRPEDRGYVKQRVADRLEGKDAPRNVLIDLVAKDGKLIPCETSGTCIKFNNKLADLVIIRDITERKEAQDAVIESNARLQSFFDAAFEGIVVTENKKFIDCNKRFAALFGYKVEEMVGMDLDEFVHPDDQEIVFNNIKENFRKPYEHRVLRKDGSVRYVEVHGKMIQYFGRKVRMTVINDITERKKAEESVAIAMQHQNQTSKMEALGEFASGIAHDFNNALTPIMGGCEVMLYQMPQDCKHVCEPQIRSILTAAETASLLVRRIQSFTRKDGSAGDLIPLNLLNCLKETFEFLRSMTPSTIEMDLHVEGKLDPVLASDITIRQVLMNVCKNAIQAIPYDEGRIDIHVTNDEVLKDRYGIRKGKYVRIEIEDTGTGMSREVVNRALDPYFTTKKQEEGSGIGLSVVNAIVKGYGGSIRIYSEEGVGTRVVIYIPCIDFEPESVAECTLSTGDEELGMGEQILLVDDEVLVIEAVQSILESLNYNVTSFTVSTKALDEFTSNPDKYDLLITDMTMPGLSGIALINAIKKVRPEIKVILCSGLGSNGKRTLEMFGDKVEAYLTKPISRLEYSEVIRKALNQ